MRKALFWVHLTAGCAAGSVILVMAVTGALLSFEPQVLRLVERHERRVLPPSPLQAPLSPERLLANVMAARPDAKPASLTLDSDPQVAALVSVGRERVVYVDPFTGRVTGDGSRRWRSFFRAVTDWHRWLAVGDESRASARSVTGACNAAFLLLSMSGLVLWWPKQWTWRHLRPVVFFQRRLGGRARDFNWHNAIGLWCAPVIFFLTLSALTISYPAIANALHPTGSPAAGAAPRQDAPPAAEAFAGLDGAWAAARERVPGWTLGVVRVPRAGAPVTVAITDSPRRSPYGRSQLSFDARSGEVAKWEPFAEFTGGRKARTAARWLHTGEILSWPGQLAAGLASLGGAFLVWTGLSLAWRRLRSWRQSSTQRNRAVATAASAPTASGQAASRESA